MPTEAHSLRKYVFPIAGLMSRGTPPTAATRVASRDAMRDETEADRLADEPELASHVGASSPAQSGWGIASALGAPTRSGDDSSSRQQPARGVKRPRKQSRPRRLPRATDEPAEREQAHMPPGKQDDVTVRAGDAEEMEVEESSRTARASRASSEHKGVCWIKSRKKWKASMKANGKTVYLGYYVDEDDAARAVADFQERGTVPPRSAGV